MRKYNFLYLFCFFLILGFGSLPDAGKSDIKQFTTLVQSSQFSAFRISSAQLKGEAVIVMIPKGKLLPGIVGVSPQNPSGYLASSAMQNLNAEVLIGSGFYQTLYPLTPTGLLVIDGNTISQLNSGGLSSIVVVKTNQVSLISKESYSNENVQGAFQVGPELVRNGMPMNLNDPRYKGNYSRAFVGTRDDGSCILGITLLPVSLSDLANFLAEELKQYNLGCTQAVNLAGGGSDVLIFKSEGKVQTFGYSDNIQPAFLIFSKPLTYKMMHPIIKK